MPFTTLGESQSHLHKGSDSPLVADGGRACKGFGVGLSFHVEAV